MSDSVELIIEAQATLGEGAIWDSKKRLFYWVDILEKQLHIFNPATSEDRTFYLDQYVGTVVPRKAGGLMLGLYHGFASFDPDTQALEIVHDPEPGRDTNRFNDGKCDPAGRFWAGTMELEGRPGAGSLYCMDTDLSVRRMLEKTGISNGIAWSLDHTTMYYIDTLTWQVAAFDYDIKTGSIANRRPTITFTKEMGHPDGMTIDEEGMLWIALCFGGRVTRWNPSNGELLQSIHVPARLVTSCAFGGPNLEQLYITTARVTLDEAALRELPLAGSVFRAEPGVRGIPAYEFGG
ncbi:MAG TPA: SMP-30/gluconolactonase/LRE family protein [Candidatus Hydrogenedentes bacterium]|nr:SMP-30/gluconolactonase/LRE family protein [Candidatus Hydrogenedentota bacterium]